MLISDVKTAFKIADVEYVPNSTRLNFNYLTNLVDEKGNLLPKDILTKNYSRVYLIVVDGEIMKFGSSQEEGGMKETLEIYRDGGINGKPDLERAKIWYFLYHTILQKKKIEFYMIYHNDFEMEVKGLFGLHKITNASINCKLIEDCCVADYISVEKKHPAWNVQEQGADWPDEIKNEHSEITKNSLDRKSNRKKIQM
ncbi:MAG: hypothetical protein Q3983_01780 [Capnocytophaga sp.]|nr:hypothetical protein [Capnocytophaga sp.]